MYLIDFFNFLVLPCRFKGNRGTFRQLTRSLETAWPRALIGWVIKFNWSCLAKNDLVFSARVILVFETSGAVLSSHAFYCGYFGEERIVCLWSQAALTVSTTSTSFMHPRISLEDWHFVWFHSVFLSAFFLFPGLFSFSFYHIVNFPHQRKYTHRLILLWLQIQNSVQ